MPDIAQIISGGLANPWLYLPAAMLLGALHALEPGHSKSLMAGFIIAIRGTAWQAALLGLSAAIGHTLVVWLLVLVALWIGSEHIEEKAYPWLVLVSGLMILAIALRLFWSLWSRAGHGQDHQHAQDHDHDHAHHPHDASCGHSHESPAALQARFAGRPVRNWEVAWFGLTGGLLPCPSAIAVLLASLKLQKIGLGAAMVGAFSIGLAATLVAVGLAAAWGVKKASGTSRFERWAAVLPLLSVTLIGLMGLGVTWHALMLLQR
jgi:nickel/cobalt transporter (NicO) family protein